MYLIHWVCWRIADVIGAVGDSLEAAGQTLQRKATAMDDKHLPSPVEP